MALGSRDGGVCRRRPPYSLKCFATHSGITTGTSESEGVDLIWFTAQTTACRKSGEWKGIVGVPGVAANPAGRGAGPGAG